MPAELQGDAQAKAAKLIGGLNLADKLCQDTLKNGKLSATLVSIIEENGLEGGCDKATGALIYMVGGKFPHSALQHRPLVVQYIKDGKIKTNDQVDEAHKYVKAHHDGHVDVAAFEAASGVGIEVTPAEVEAAVTQVVTANEGALREERYHFNVNKLLPQVKAIRNMYWADIVAVKAQLDAQQAALLGPKTEEDLKPKEKTKKVKAPKEKKVVQAAAAVDETWKTADPYSFLPKPEDNFNVHEELPFSDGHTERYANTRAELAQHLERTGGKVVTRFPPEPNGYLHIGHSKAMFVDFGMAQRHQGICYLRFDDTNPEAEKQEYIDHIQDIVRWMGWSPVKVTYSSDYFVQLHAYAIQLIKTGYAYVCHQTGEEIKASREVKQPSPYRDRPAAESLKVFEDMRRGLWDEGSATLRLKMDILNDNLNMLDVIAYRIKFVPHPHAKDAWCIYPSYDFTHCIVDSLEDITHSLCTLEFETRRASYYWLLDKLGIYKPVVWEYARLNITNNVMSKRKLQVLVNEGHVRAWDDPRMMTLAGLRRRGVTPEAINNLCREVGITRSDNEITLHKLDFHVRAHLDETSSRALAVLSPLKLVIANLPEDHLEQVECAVFPGRTTETYKAPFSKVVYIESTDFRTSDEKDYYGLAPGKSIMLRYAYPVAYQSHSTDAEGRVTEVVVEYDKDFAGKGKPPKGVLNWVGQLSPGKEPTRFEARLYAPLFNSQSPADLGDAWLEDLNSESEKVVSGGYLTPHLAKAKPGTRYQFERLGYFCCDNDSSADMIVFNRTTTLRDSYK